MLRGNGKRFAVPLAGIAIFAFAGRLTYVLAFSDQLHFGLDTVWYQLSAGTLALGKGFVDPGRFYSTGATVATAFRPPLYSAFLAVVIKTFDGSRETFQIAGCFVGTATVVLIGLLGRRVGGNTVGLCAAAFAAVSPALVGFDASVMTETIYVPLVTAALLALYAAIDRPTAGRWLLVGALIGACILTRGDALLLLPLLVVPGTIVASRTEARRRYLLCLGAAALGAAVVVVPWVLRNDARVGVPTLATLDSGTAIAGTNCHGSYFGSKLGSWDPLCAEIAARPGEDEAAVNRRLTNDGLRYLRAHVTRVPLVVSARVLRLWGVWDPAGEVRLESIESRNVVWQVVTLCAYVPIAVLAGYGIFLMRRERARVIPIVSVLASVTLAAAITYGKQRFRAAAEPVLLVSASVAAVHLVRRRSGRAGAPGERLELST
ncbi:MAG: glycosyltransferase family 39 protein [Actinobacteria bacterium]|nr:glycosyltransferase family 39 protein [Actinomycetota bacterium]